MKVYLGFDDTDHHNSLYGTGKLVRWFQDKLPEQCACIGVVRQQLLVHAAVPYTSHNSSACMILEVPDASLMDTIIGRAIAHIESFSVEGSDPGLCVASEEANGLDEIMAFGQQCTNTLSTQKQALEATRHIHLSGHGGTNDGIIGATAAVGLTHWGWAGRYIELESLRHWPQQTTIAKLRAKGIGALSMDRNARMPGPDDVVMTNGWLRPRLIGKKPILLVKPAGESKWENIDSKRKKKPKSSQTSGDDLTLKRAVNTRP
jgi:hypothetical protein